jgi:chromate transporter
VTPDEAPAPDGLRQPASPAELFRVFNGLALQGFGGVLPVAQRVLVERQRWLSREQFVETLSLGQVLPGPNIVNMALMIGDRFFGLRGAAAALGGLLTAPLLIVLTLAALYGQLSGVPAVAGALRGMGAVSAGLIISTAIKVMPTLKSNPLGVPLAALFVVTTALAIGWWRVPLVWVVLGLGAVSMGLAARKLRR